MVLFGHGKLCDPSRNQAGFARRRVLIVPQFFCGPEQRLARSLPSVGSLREYQCYNDPRMATSAYIYRFEDFQVFRLSYDGQVAPSMAIKAVSA